MNRAQALGIITILWAAIFLPALGSTEIKGEEGRRIEPAVEMLETGDWLVPHFNGRPYLRKPPLVNWAIASSFKIFAVRNEWTARLPSVLSVLALALTIVGVGSGWLGAERALMAAIFTLVNAGMLEKGRLAEIEALYISLYGIAITCWLSWWAQRRSPWLVWLVPSVFLGLGLLAKAPLHLLFFYAVVIVLAAQFWRLRKNGAASVEDAPPVGFFSLPHLIGASLMIGIFAAWAVPYLRATTHLNATGVWTEQMKERVSGGIDWRAYAENFPRGLSNYLPWVLFLPMLWSRVALTKLSARDAAIVRALRWPVVVCFFGLVLLHSQILPRYTLPMIVPTSLLLALVMKARFESRALRWSLWAGGIAALGMCVFAVTIVPRMNAKAETRQFAQRINDIVSPNETLYVFDPGILPAVFYIRSHIVYAYGERDLPENANFLFVRDRNLERMRKNWRDSRVLAELTDKNKNKFFLLQLRGKL